MLGVHSSLTGSPLGKHRWTRLGLCLIPLWLLQGLPASAQEAGTGSPGQPPPAAEEAEEAKESSPTAPEEPKAPAEPDSLEDLLQEEVAPASVGSFGYRLRRYGITPYVHGVLSADLFQWQRRTGDAPHRNTFKLRDANLYFGADILDIIVPEVFLEFEPSFTSYEFNTGIRLRYAQVDVRLYKELVVLRAGLFMIPFGTYNTTTFPAFITKLPERPTVFREVVPTPWQEVGIQLGGEWEWASGRSLRYALYATNGMEQYDVDNLFDPSDDGIDEGGSIAFFTPSYEDANNTRKSFGARLSTQITEGLTLGASGYLGAYTKDAARDLSIFGVDANFVRGPLTLELEAALARQEVLDGTLDKWGYSAVVAYRFNSWFEPLVSFDHVRVGTLPAPFDGRSFAEDASSVWAGFIYYPFPEQIPTALAKTVYRVTNPRADTPMSHRLIIQLALGF
ncbi:hypothetical protein [Hyalangium gracile]|uniref:hypothetical protein n=1 Tax=Hyalangium gracile TaxID=394092 RepID=UPI001CCC66D5|nr:hypothetical protein [Hyalangium gracile]